MRSAMSDIAIHLEADYSIQMIADIANGNLDAAVMYQPRYLPDVRVEELFTETMVMVASAPMTIDTLGTEDYVRVFFTPGFDKMHADLLPHLSQPPMSGGLDGVAQAILRSRKAAAYFTETAAQRLIRDEGFSLVVGAPVIQIPVYLTLPTRRLHDHSLQTAIRLLRHIVRPGTDHGHSAAS